MRWNAHAFITRGLAELGLADRRASRLVLAGLLTDRQQTRLATRVGGQKGRVAPTKSCRERTMHSLPLLATQVKG